MSKEVNYIIITGGIVIPKPEYVNEDNRIITSVMTYILDDIESEKDKLPIKLFEELATLIK